MEWKQKVDTNLGITVILVFAALFTIVGFYVVGAHIDGYPFDEFSSNVSDIQDKDNVIVEDKDVFENKNEKSKSDLIYDCTFSEDYCILLDEDNKKLEYYNWN